MGQCISIVWCWNTVNIGPDADAGQFTQCSCHPETLFYFHLLLRFSLLNIV